MAKRNVSGWNRKYLGKSFGLFACILISACFGGGNPTDDDFEKVLTTFFGEKVKVENVEGCEQQSINVGFARLVTRNDEDVIACIVTFSLEEFEFLYELADAKPATVRVWVALAKDKNGVWNLAELRHMEPS